MVGIVTMMIVDDGDGGGDGDREGCRTLAVVNII